MSKGASVADLRRVPDVVPSTFYLPPGYLLTCHLQFDKSGQWLIVANQDSDDCAVFNFNCSTGQVAFTGNSFKCPSPNFVCVWNGA